MLTSLSWLHFHLDPVGHPLCKINNIAMHKADASRPGSKKKNLKLTT